MPPFYFGTIHKLHFCIFEAFGWPPFFELYGCSLLILGLAISHIFAFLKLRDGPYFWSLWISLFYFGTIHKLHFCIFEAYGWTPFLKLMDEPSFIFGLSTNYIFAFLKPMEGPLCLPFYFGTIHKLHFRIFEAYGWPPFLKLMDGPLFWSLWMVPFYFGTIHKLNFCFLKLMEGPFYFRTIHKLHPILWMAPFFEAYGRPLLFWDYS